MALILVASFLVALIVSGLVRTVGILDHPNTRSNHSTPTPRSGGLGILAGFFIGSAMLSDLPPAAASALLAVLVVGAFSALIGFVDDLFSLSGRLKLLLISALSLSLAAAIGPVTDLGFTLPWIVGLLGSALWVFTTINAVNFMDGSDGIMAAALIPALLVLGLMGDGAFAISSFALAAAIAGFAVWNIPVFGRRGSLFSGDVGSLGAASLFAGLALYWAVVSEPGSVWLVPLLIMPLLADVLLTMAARFRAGRRLFVAHRAHAYQLLIRLGLGHGQVALIWGGLALGFGALALLGHAGPFWMKPAVFVIGVAVSVGLHRHVRTKAREAGLDVTQ
jgi:UDP-N-acetylmuramyl pentapeptide phosphotransferase/UDP-N-acetylglucosamine-1-phosphate transferase